MSEQDDRSLWRALLQGDHAAWERFFHATWLPALRFATARLRDRALAEDVAGESFAALLASLSSFDADAGTLGAFLFGILRHRVSNARRGRGAVFEDLNEHDLPEPERDAGDDEPFVTALADLEVSERDLLIRHHSDGVPTSELAQESGVSLEAMQSRLARVRRKLREKWERRLETQTREQRP